MPNIPENLPPFEILPPTTSGDDGTPSSSIVGDVNRVFRFIDDERHLVAHKLFLTIRQRLLEGGLQCTWEKEIEDGDTSHSHTGKDDPTTPTSATSNSPSRKPKHRRMGRGVHLHPHHHTHHSGIRQHHGKKRTKQERLQAEKEHQALVQAHDTLYQNKERIYKLEVRLVLNQLCIHFVQCLSPIFF